MAQKKTDREFVLNLTVGGILTAIVIVLQVFASAIRLGPFQVSLVLVPIVIGAAMCNFKISTWLGVVFGAVVLLNGDATAFLAISAPATIAVVLVKGAACGLVCGLIYNALENKNRYFAIVFAAISAPIVNTGIFLLGCRLFFFPTISEWGIGSGYDNPVAYMLLGLAGGNFLFEMSLNIVLCPVIFKVINIAKGIKKRA